jgi:hypothetical protein
MAKRNPYDIKQKCQRDECTRESYELIKSPITGDERFVCSNCWNYLLKQSKTTKQV